MAAGGTIATTMPSDPGISGGIISLPKSAPRSPAPGTGGTFVPPNNKTIGGLGHAFVGVGRHDTNLGNHFASTDSVQDVTGGPGPLENTTGTATSTTTGSSTATGAALTTSWTAQQQAAIQNVVSQVVDGIGAGETVASIQAKIASGLAATGLFTSTDLATLEQGASVFGSTHGGSFEETDKGGGNSAGFIATLMAGINNASQDYFAQNGITNAGSSSAAASDTTGTPLSQLLSALSTDAAASPTVAQTPDSTGAQLATTQGTSNSGMIIGLVLVIAALGIGYFWYKHKHKGAHAGAHHGDE